jgi:hypothetical protein
VDYSVNQTKAQRTTEKISYVGTLRFLYIVYTRGKRIRNSCHFYAHNKLKTRPNGLCWYAFGI